MWGLHCVELLGSVHRLNIRYGKEYVLGEERQRRSLECPLCFYVVWLDRRYQKENRSERKD